MTKLLQLDPRRMNLGNLTGLKRPQGAALLGLDFDGSRLEGVLVRRTNGSIEIKKTFSATLSLDLLTDEPDLVGREIRKHLEAADIRERWCAVCLPLNWALTLATKLPELPEEDLRSFIQMEAERGFPYAPDALVLSQSRFQTKKPESFATLVAVPRDHIARLEAVLKAAQLRPVSLTLGAATLQSPDPEAPEGTVGLVPGDNHVSLLITGGGGVVVLRTIEGAFEVEGGEKRIQADQVAREIRITFGPLPVEIRDTVHRLRVFGRSDVADELAEQLRPRLEPLGIRVEQVREYPKGDLGVQLPPGTAVSPALSVAVRYLTGQGSGFEFLPAKVSAWKQMADRYSTGKLFWSGVAAGAVAMIVALAFAVQQWQLVRWRSKWNAIRPRVTELEKMQQQIRTYRPWFDESFRSLSILRRLTEAFPEDGTVSAKTVEIRQLTPITCLGTARDYQSLLRTRDKLRESKEVREVRLESIRGRSPMQFTLNFQWSEEPSR